MRIWALEIFAAGLAHFVAGIEAGKFLREGFAKAQGFGAFGDHHVAHRLPHARELALLVLLRVGFKPRHAPQRFLEIRPQDANTGCRWRFGLHPNVQPFAISAAPIRADLPGIFAAALGNEAEAVN